MKALEILENLKKLCEELNEGALIQRIDSFIKLNEGLETKKGKEFIEVSLLGFAEGILTTLKTKYKNEKISELLEETKKAREELEQKFRRAKIPYFEGQT
jgi:hypothetical protein